MKLITEHTSGLAVSDTEPSEIEITVGADERGFVMEIWAESLDILSVAITSPSGERISRIPARIDTGGSTIFTGTFTGCSELQSSGICIRL